MNENPQALGKLIDIRAANWIEQATILAAGRRTLHARRWEDGTLPPLAIPPRRARWQPRLTGQIFSPPDNDTTATVEPIASPAEDAAPPVVVTAPAPETIDEPARPAPSLDDRLAALRKEVDEIRKNPGVGFSAGPRPSQAPEPTAPPKPRRIVDIDETDDAGAEAMELSPEAMRALSEVVPAETFVDRDTDTSVTIVRRSRPEVAVPTDADVRTLRQRLSERMQRARSVRRTHETRVPQASFNGRPEEASVEIIRRPAGAEAGSLDPPDGETAQPDETDGDGQDPRRKSTIRKVDGLQKYLKALTGDR